MSDHVDSEPRGRLALFPPDEFRHRVARAQAGMRADGIDAMLVTSETNHVYFSGLVTPSFATRARPITLLVPVDGEPVAIVSRNQFGQAVAVSWVPDIRFHRGLEAAALDLLADVIRERGLEGGRIACELGEEQRLGMSYVGFQALQASLPRVEWHDAAPLLWRLRSIKSPLEVACLREIGTILGRAYERMITATRVGAIERDVHRALLVSLVEQGADMPSYAAIHSGPGNYARIGGPTDRCLEAGDLLWADTGVAKNGYYADYMRLISLGRPTERHSRLYEIAHEAVQRMLGTVKPGVPIAELMRVCRHHFSSHGVELGAATRVGHGVGADLAEPPSIVDGNELPLEVGMVLAIEPSIADDDGFIGVEENFVVTDSGFELLSIPSQPTLPVVEV